jgi:hypothetical protein
MKKIVLFFLFDFVICFFANTLNSQPQLDLPDLVSQSSNIMRARVTALSAQWINDQNGKHIYTTAQLEPISALKGTAPSSLIYIGGTVDTITEVVSDMFILKRLDEAFFFLPANVEKFTAGKITVLSIKEDMIRKDDAVIKATAVESAIRAMIKTPSLKMKFKDLSNNVIDPVHTAPLQNQMMKLGKVSSLPDLRPYLVWNSYNYPIIIRKTPVDTLSSSDTDSSPLNDNDSTLISFSVANYGTDTAPAFSVKIYIDTLLFWTQNISSLTGMTYIYWLNRYVASIPAGTHTIKMVIDPDHVVTESNTTNNEYTRSITVSHVSGVPVITSISPSSVSAGTNSSVTITGSGFGATKGSSVVEFFYQSGHSKILAPVVSWSDTQIICKVPIGTIDYYDAAASSGPVTVRTVSGVSSGYNVTVTFANGGVKWNASSVTYKINENYAPLAGEGAAVRAAFTTWNNGGAAFLFQYGGATTIIASSFDATNAILWGTTSGSLASNYYWLSGSTLTQSDIVFSNTEAWGIGSNYDIQSVATHELGHSLNLRDQYGNGDLPEIMYGFSSSGEIKRNLTTAEIDGIRWIYGVLPVELTSFTARTSSTGTSLLWTTATEVNNYGFEIEKRAISSQGSGSNWYKIGFVVGNGTSNNPHSYSYTDNTMTSGKYIYRLKQIDNNGVFKYSDEAEVSIGVPSSFALNQNFPNPFNPSTTIRFGLPVRSRVKLEVFNILGQSVVTLIEGEKEAGFVEAIWQANVSSGLYIYRIEAISTENPNQRFMDVKKMLLLR